MQNRLLQLLFVWAIGYLISFPAKVYSQLEPKNSDTLNDRLVNIGFHKLYISERGSSNARFTVVFESGAGGSSQDWTKVRDLLPPEIRTVAYDRAGTGKSEKGPLPNTMAQQVFELHSLLERANIKGSLILVGQSIGGLLVRLYTETYGQNVAALVLVDPTHESAVLGSMRYGGWVRLREKATGKFVPQPQLKEKISAGYDSTADYMAEEFQKMYLSSLKNPQPLNNRPLIVLCAGIRDQPPGTPDEQWKQLRAERDTQVQELAKLSGNSQFIVDAKSRHAIQNDDPEIVAKSIHTVIQSLISHTKL